MSAPCGKWDQDLLLLAHNELGAVRALRVKLHMHTCPKCRARFTELAAVSMAVAGAIRFGLPAWKPAIVVLPLRMKVMLSVLAAGTTFLAARTALDAPVEAEAASISMCKVGAQMKMGKPVLRPSKAEKHH